METIDSVYVLDKSLEISKIGIARIDDCGFAEFTVDGEKYNYWLKGPSVQSAHYVFGANTHLLVSLEYKSVEAVKVFIQNKMRDVISEIKTLTDKIIDEHFD